MDRPIFPSIFTPRDCARGKVIGSVVVIVVVVVVVVDTIKFGIHIWASALLVSTTKRLSFAENWLQLLQIHTIPLVLQFAVFADQVMLFVLHHLRMPIYNGDAQLFAYT